MTPAREAIALPVVFLTVLLLGAVRVGDRTTLIAPAQFSLVLALLFVGVLVRSGALAASRLMGAGRRPLANLNGAIVLATLFAATAQAFTLSTPEYGLPRPAFSVFLLVLLLNTFAAAPDREHVLRSAAVIFGSAFILKFIVLAALSDPAGSRLGRALQLLIEGASLGTLSQQPYRPVTGYVAFAALALFVGALALLPSARHVGPTHAIVVRERGTDLDPVS